MYYESPPMNLTFTTISWLIFASSALQAGPSVWHDRVTAEFLRGELQGVTLSSEGEVSLAPERSDVFSNENVSMVWAMAVDSKGAVYAATGNDGLLFKIAGGNAEVVWDSKDPEIMSVAVDAKDNVYAAGSPSGQIYRVSPQGKAELFAETGQKYVWAMAISPSGDIFAGTGPSGKLLKIDTNKKISELYDSEDPHILTLALAKDGRLCAGTAGRGLVYQWDKGKISTAYDANLGEIRCMAFDDSGHLYFGTASGANMPFSTRAPLKIQPPPPPPGGPRAGANAPLNAPLVLPNAPPAVDSNANPEDTAIEDKADAPIQAATGPSSSNASKKSKRQAPTVAKVKVKGSNAVYRLDKQGQVTELFTVKETLVYSLLVKGSDLYIGTGPDSGLFKLKDFEYPVKVDHDGEMNLLSLSAASDGVLVGSGNPGKVFKLSSNLRKRGAILSEVKDAKMVSRFGQLSWRAIVVKGTKLTLSTRSGNVEEPDGTWSDWSKEYAQPGSVESPAARFFQYRATLTTEDTNLTPQLYEVKVAYIQQNLPPKITRIVVGSSSTGAGKKPSKGSSVTDKHFPPQVLVLPELGTALRSTTALSWTASDPNSDQLSYSLYFRLRGEKRWNEIVERTKNSKYKWDTLRLPDGWYELKLNVDDEETNGRRRMRETELVTPLVLVDNSGPAVKEIRPAPVVKGSCSIRIVLRDNFIQVAKVSYALDGQAWKSLMALDDIFDSQSEEVEIELSDLEPGIHTIVLLAKDKAGNGSIRRFTITAPEEK